MQLIENSKKPSHNAHVGITFKIKNAFHIFSPGLIYLFYQEKINSFDLLAATYSSTALNEINIQRMSALEQ